MRLTGIELQIQEYLKNATTQLERENAMYAERNVATKSSTSENANETDGGTIAVLLILFGMCVAVVIVKKRKRKA